MLQESDPFHDLSIVKVEPQELVIADLQIFKTEIIDLDFENVIYEEEPANESNICLKEIDELVIENNLCQKEINDPISRQTKKDKPTIIECVKCVEVFDHKDPKIAFDMFRKHMIQHNRQKHMCLLCDPPLRFAQELHLEHHNYILHGIGVNPLVCKTCDFISNIEDKNYWNNYRAHLKTHKITYTPTKHFSENIIQHHISDKHHIVPTLQCNICQKVFDTVAKFKRNQKRCSKRFKIPIEKPVEKRVQKHVKKTAKLSCTLCSRRIYYDSEINLQYHLFSKHQIGENPHKCTICNKTFDFSIQLKRHNDETGTCKPSVLLAAKTYKCYICNEEFAMLVSKHQHIDTYHADKANGDCHLCLRKRIPSACAFEKHISEHFAEYTCICNYCGRGFHQEGRLTNHIRFIHEIKYLYCDICGAKHKVIQLIIAI